jgi:hypothetical protein
MNNTVSRPSLLLGAAALLCLLVVQVATAGGGSGERQATASGVNKRLNKVNRKVRKQKKRLKELEDQVEEVSKQQGPQGPSGPQGPQGASGQDATKLFAYVGATGNLIYGSGATDASKTGSTGQYAVAFNQDLERCVALASDGRGDPDGFFGTSGGSLVAEASDINSDDTVDVTTFTSSTGSAADSAFMLAVFC